LRLPLQSPLIKLGYSQMSGIWFDNPALRFLRRSSFFEKMTRTLASPLDHWLIYAERCSIRIGFRPCEAEFPAAQIACERRTLRGLPAADRASMDALRPSYNWIKLKDQHEISFFREKFAAFTRRIPTKGRRPVPLPKRDPESASQEIILAEDRRAVFEWRTPARHPRGGPQWLAAVAACT